MLEEPSQLPPNDGLEFQAQPKPADPIPDATGSESAQHNEAQNAESQSRMLSAEEYRTRRSSTLSDNPEAILDENQEIKSYFETQDPSYVERIQRSANLDHTMNSACRIIVTIPAYNEGTRIKHDLEQYAKQRIDPHLFEIVIAVYLVAGDETADEIAKFQKENPGITITTVNLIAGEDKPVTVGLNRKLAADTALARIWNRGAQERDTLLVINDADSLALDENYLLDILNEFDENHYIDALATATALPPEAMAKPNVAAAFLITDVFEKTFVAGDVGEDTIPEPALMGGTGTSSAVRASMYAAAGGFNPLAVIGENWELGWVIADARNWNPDRIIYFEKTHLVTDPRRIIDAVANRIPADQGLLKFESDLNVRRLDTSTVLDSISNNLDFELLEDDVNSLWGSRRTGSNIRIGERRFNLLFDATMSKLGIQYRINQTDGVELTNIDELISKLSTGGQNINVIHSQPRVYTPEMIEQIHSLFATFPEGSMKARDKQAERVAAEIRLTQSRGEVQHLPELLRSYERFARHDYDVPA